MNEQQLSNAEQIAALNDQFRRDPYNTALGNIVLTQAVGHLPRDKQMALIQAVSAFNTFNEGNDPWGEHDRGRLEFEQNTYEWKIDYYAKNDFDSGSEDPADSAVTSRVLTIMDEFDA